MDNGDRSSNCRSSIIIHFFHHYASCCPSSNMTFWTCAVHDFPSQKKRHDQCGYFPAMWMITSGQVSLSSSHLWTFNPSVTSVTWCSVVKSRELFCWLSLRFKLPYHCEQSISIMSRSPGKKKHEKTRPATTTLEYFGYVSETQPTGPETSLSPGHRPVGFPPMATSKKAFLVTLGVTLA